MVCTLSDVPTVETRRSIAIRREGISLVRRVDWSLSVTTVALGDRLQTF